MRQERLVERPRAVLEMTIDAFPVDLLPFKTVRICQCSSPTYRERNLTKAVQDVHRSLCNNAR